jgi:hypothetical protein
MATTGSDDSPLTKLSLERTLLVKFVAPARKIPNVCELATPRNISAQPVRVAFAHVNSPVMFDGYSGGVLGDLARRAIIKSRAILRVKRISSRGKMECGHGNVRTKIEIARSHDWPFSRNGVEVPATGTRRKSSRK